MDAQEWNALYGDLPNRVSGLEDRVETLEDVAGLTPESPIDAQTANLIQQPDTLTNAALSTEVGEQANLPASPFRAAADLVYAPVAGSSEYVGEEHAQPRQTGIAIRRHDLATQNVGTSGYGSNTGIAYCLLNATDWCTFLTSIIVPDWVTTIYADMLWMALTPSGAGVPRMRVAVGSHRTDGFGTPSTPAIPASGDLYPALSATALSVQRTTFGPWTVDPTRDITVEAGRIGNSSSDTANTTELGLVGIDIWWS